ncbi:MAG TPA: FAD-dependent oxidoreductase [Candidatus Micrarchaeia archaeon]|nr:FAD-dependent oxidoreductase [Candidatus Micrarchaeia archaeon]
MSRPIRAADLVVVGGGAAGISAAQAAAQRGVSVLLVHAGAVGGDCTFTGCVPSKALIEAAARGASFETAMAAARSAVRSIAATETPEVLQRRGVATLEGWARLRSPREVDVDGRTVRARRLILATGAGPAIPKIPGLERSPHLTNETIFDLRRRPASLIVLGGGAVGCEIAQALARLGVTVTVLEAMDRLLGAEEPEASAAVAAALAADGVRVRVGARAAAVEPVPTGGVTVGLEGRESMAAETLLVAVGRRPATCGLDLGVAGVQTDARGFIVTDSRLATTAPGVYAVGDVAGRLLFTHAAAAMGRIAAANALARFPRRRFNPTAIPWVTFTDPEVGRVGMTEAEAAEHGGRVAFLPMAAVDRAVVAGRTSGFVKLIAGPRPLLRSLGGGRVLGATVVAARGGELIHEPALAMATHMFPGRLALAVHAYPTWSLAIQQAAAQLFVEVGGRRARPAQARPPGSQ